MELNKEIIAGSLSPIILMILRRKESYGYEIIQELREKSGATLDIAEGTLYPVLKKMEAKEWIVGTWKKSEAGRERKYYKMTKKGRKELESQYSQLSFVHDLILKLWKLPVSTSIQP